MPKQEFAFEQNGPKRLEISWGMFWKNITLRLDGKELDSIATQMEFRQGKEYRLPDGTTLNVKLANSMLGQDIQVTRNGKPLPGSAQHPEARIRASYTLLYFIGGWKILFGILGVFVNGLVLTQFNFETISLLLGVVFIFLASMVRKRSLPALIAGILLFAADAIYGAYAIYQAGNQPNVFTLVIDVFLVYYLYQGVKAIQKEKTDDF